MSKPIKSKFRLSNRKPPVAFETLIADYVLMRVLRPFSRAKSFRIIVVLPPSADVVIWSEAAGGPMSLMFPTDKFQRSDWDVDTLNRKPHGLMSCQYPKHLIFVAHDAVDLVTPEMRAGAEAVFSLGEVTADIVKRVAELRFGRSLSHDTARAVAELPFKVREYVMRPGADVRKIIARMEKVAGVKEAAPSPAAVKTNTPRLEDLHGYGEAQDWGLQLARDLTDYGAGTITWDDVDRGLLLSGPPGCGKTTYARALAETCGVPLITGSYAEWQSAGHQGDMLKAMREAFKKAARSTPSILFVDEMDAFVTRRDGDDHNDQYMRGVVNGFLECLDGSFNREGVVVVGATNQPDAIDPAIRRSGRLDCHISIPLPDATARSAILRWHLQTSAVDVREVIGRTDGMSGADLERIARDARRAARVARRSVETGDLIAALPVRIPYSLRLLRSTAIHEAGHAIVGLILDVGKLDYVEIEADYDPKLRAQSGGQAAWEFHNRFMRSRKDYEGMICMSLAAMEAERALLGTHYDGANSDLRQASIWAGAMVSAYGMDARLVSVNNPFPDEVTDALRRDARLQEAVDRILQAQRARAGALVDDHLDLIKALTERLLRERRVDGEEVVEMIRNAMNAPLQLSLVI